METIRHRVGIDAPLPKVREALVTTDGVAQWWTRDVRSRSIADEMEVWFGGEKPAATLTVDTSDETSVRWSCLQGPPEWIGSTINFELNEPDDSGETVVLFSHEGWQEPVEFMHHCSTSWSSYLRSLKHALEQDAGEPWPDNERVSSWG